MLHKIKGKSLISLRIPCLSPTVLPYCFIQDVLPNPPSLHISYWLYLLLSELLLYFSVLFLLNHMELRLKKISLG